MPLFIFFQEDVSIMCKNAQIFNEPGSIIYKDARVILKTIKQKNFELEAAKKARENRGTRARSRGPAQSRKQYAAEVRLLKIKLTHML